MNLIHRRRIASISILSVVLTLVVGLIMYALRQNISLFYTPTQLMQSVKHKYSNIEQHTIRIGGMIKKHSIARAANGLTVTFALTDFTTTVLVKYNGILPDLFREGQGVVATGMWRTPGYFKAIEILAKHDANYMPPEIKSILKGKMNG